MSLELRQWMETVSGEGWHWYVKRLAGNDTLLTAAHQAGPYVAKPIAFKLFPSVQASTEKNPRARFEASIDSHGAEAAPTLIWYNNKLTDGRTRHECRITNWGGKVSPILDPDATGAICIFAFFQEGEYDSKVCRIWLCGSTEEEDAAEDRVGPVEPGLGFLYNASGKDSSLVEVPSIADAPCHLAPDEIPSAWNFIFPEAATVVAFAVARAASARQKPPDERLVRRRKCEYEVFRSVEAGVVLPRITEGFATVDLFMDFANSVTNRRKARSGASLELHARTIFEEESVPHAYNARTERRKRPDFLFPSAAAYQDPKFPTEKLRMLGVKTTCKDRWRQVIDEAERIPEKHLLTLQEGVSLTQFAQMRAAGLRLVVPRPLHKRFHKKMRPHLLSLGDFIRHVKKSCS